MTDLQHLKGLTEIGLKQAEKLKSRETKDDKVSVDDSLPHVLCDREGQDKKKIIFTTFSYFNTYPETSKFAKKNFFKENTTPDH